MGVAHQRPPLPRPPRGGRPHPARVASYLLRGRVHTQADRAFAESLVSQWPRWAADLRASEVFLTRAVRGLYRDGFDQVVDVSPVLPTPDGPYGTAGVGARVRLVRVDPDPATAAQSTALIRDTRHRVVERDPQNPGAVVATIRSHRLLDLRRPVVLLAGCGAWESLPTESVLEGVLSAWGRALPDGSVLVFTHDSDDARTAVEVTAARAARILYASLGLVFTARKAAALDLALRNTGWVPTRPPALLTPTGTPVDGPTPSPVGRLHSRVASVVAGIAEYRPRRRARAGRTSGSVPDFSGLPEVCAESDGPAWHDAEERR
ncbi:SAM-dependent methyltransferase [Actinosynnema sp. NPDC050436]|uniref:SAM-dependent methyltransferase n=1 Tax=Actinosynnema sp. NPDC050436 TaxID=3155659 RepID=UPI0034066F56